MSSKEATPGQPSADQVISQAEVERLLASMGAGDPADPDVELAARMHSQESPLTERHVFPQLSQFSASQLRKLRLRHEEFIRSLAARLSVHLRLEVGMQMSKLECVSFQQFADGLSNPTHLSLIRLEPLAGVGVLELPPRLGLSIVDRELGGPGVCTEETRDLNPMEARLLSQVTEIILAEWCSCCGELPELRLTLAGTESSGRFLEFVPPNTPFVVLGIEARLGDLVDQVQFAFPCKTLEPLVQKLSSSPGFGDSLAEAGSARSAPVAWNPAVANLRVRVSAGLPALKLSVKRLGELKPGDVLPLDVDAINRLQVCVEGVPKFKGSLGTCEGKRAVAIARIYAGSAPVDRAS